MKQVRSEKALDGLAILLNHLLVIAAIITVFDMFQIEGAIVVVCILSLFVPVGYYLITHRPQKLVPPPIFIVVLQGMVWLEKIIKASDWESAYIVIAFLYLIGCFFYYFGYRFLQFLSLNERSASNIPKREIFQSGMKQTAVFGIGSLGILILTANFDWVKRIADRIWDWLLQVLITLFAGVEMPPPPEELPAEEVENAASDIGSVVDREMFPVFVQETVKTVVTAAVFIAFVCGCILLLLLVYEFLKKYLTPYKRKKLQDAFQSNEDIREYCGVEHGVQKRKQTFLFLNSREKIRKIYQKKILKRRQELIGEAAQKQLEYMTAKECCDRLAEQNLKRMYEKARYSAEEVSAEDVRLARSIK